MGIPWIVGGLDVDHDDRHQGEEYSHDQAQPNQLFK